jgi:hypothetical protein
MSQPNQPCGCHDPLLGDAAGFAIPSLDEFEQSLQLLSAAPLGADGGLNDLDLADLESSLAVLEEPFLGGDQATPELADLVRLLERHPGLKISLSF